MQMGAGRAAGGTHIADDLSGRHILTGADDIVGHMHIDGSKSVTVVDGDVIARAAGLIGSRRHLSALGSIDWRALRRRHIHAVVHFPHLMNGMDPHAEGAGDAVRGQGLDHPEEDGA